MILVLRIIRNLFLCLELINAWRTKKFAPRTQKLQVSVSFCSSEANKKMKIKKFSHAVGQNSYHLVWKPKYSWDCFKFPWVKKDCEAILKEAVERYKMKLFELEVMPDHIHLFVEIPPTMSVSKALNLLKGYSSFKLFRKQRWLRKYFRKGHLWSPGKFFRSVGNVTAEAIKNYIAESNRNAKTQKILQ